MFNRYTDTVRSAVASGRHDANSTACNASFLKSGEQFTVRRNDRDLPAVDTDVPEL